MDKIARGFLTLAFSLVCTVPAFAGNAVLYSGALFTPGFGMFGCFLTNVGSQPLSAPMIQVIDNTGADVTELPPTCGATLAAGQTCIALEESSILFPGGVGIFHCKFTFRGPKKAARATAFAGTVALPAN